MTTYSSEYLRNLPTKHRLDVTMRIVDEHVRQILQIATTGATSYTFRSFMTNNQGGLKYECVISPQDFVEGFRARLLGCRIEYTETWEDVRTGVREQKRGILIDWS